MSMRNFFGVEIGKTALWFDIVSEPLMFLGVSSPVFSFIQTKLSDRPTTAFIIGAVSSVISLIILPLYNVGRKKHKERDMEIARQQLEAAKTE